MSFLREVVVLGTTGSGKSSLGNTLLGRNAFEVTPLVFNSVTTEIEKKSNDEITVTEIPGLPNTKRTVADIAMDILSSRNGCPYPHAFLIVFDATKRNTNDNQVIMNLLSYLLNDTLSYAIVVFTKVNDKIDDETFESFWKEDNEMRKFIEKCGGRIVRIDNQGKERVTRAREIINLVDEISDNGKKRFDIPLRELSVNVLKLKADICSFYNCNSQVDLLTVGLATEKYKYERKEYLVQVIMIWSALAGFILGVGLFLMLLGYSVGLLFFGVGTFGIWIVYKKDNHYKIVYSLDEFENHNKIDRAVHWGGL